MRREGRQRGQVRMYDRALVGPEGKRRAEHVVRDSVVQEEEEEEVVVVEEPQFHPPLGARSAEYYYSTTCQSPFRYKAVPYEWQYEAFVLEELQAPRPPPSSPAARFRGRASFKGSRKFKHNEIKMYYSDAADDVDGRLDYYFDS